jgi:hypothetical protein
MFRPLERDGVVVPRAVGQARAGLRQTFVYFERVQRAQFAIVKDARHCGAGSTS